MQTFSAKDLEGGPWLWAVPEDQCSPPRLWRGGDDGSVL